MKAERSYLVLSYLAVMLLLYVKQSIHHIFAVFTVEITTDTHMCRPVDTTVYFRNSSIAFCGGSDLAGLLGREMLTCVQTASLTLQVILMFVIRYHCFSSLGNSSELLDVSAWTNSTDQVCSVPVLSHLVARIKN